MHKNLPLPLALMLVACASDYSIDPPTEFVATPNPRDLTTPVQIDAFKQVQKPQVDILWVVDNSGSMQQEQDAVADNFTIFMDYFLGSGLDYHIGVVSTDMENAGHKGNLQQAAGVRWIEAETENPVEVFEEMFVLGTGGSSTEAGRAAAYTALEIRKDGANIGFLRDDSAVHVIVVADETDLSSNDPVSKGEFIAYLNGLRDDPEMVTFSSIVSPEPPAELCGTAQSYGGYIDITAQVGGVYWSVCNPDWGDALDQLGLQASGLKREYFLTELPLASTIEVSVFEAGVTYTFEPYDELTGLGDWTYAPPRNSITFLSYVPSPLAEVRIEYTPLAATDEGS